MKILLVDDEQDILKLLEKALQQDGHDIYTKENGEDALNFFLEEGGFDVVLTDIKMPVMDGIELLGRIRREDYETPVVIITGHGDFDLSLQALRLGAFDFIEKPFRIKSLKKTLSKIEAIRSSKQEPLEAVPFINNNIIDISIPSSVGLINNIVAFFQSQIDFFCRKYKLESAKLCLCLREALVNAVVHGNLEVPSVIKEGDWENFDKMVKERERHPEFGGRKVGIHYQVKDQCMIYEIADQGHGFDVDHLPNLNDPLSCMEVSGRGLIIIRSFMDEVTWNKEGNIIRMIKNLSSSKEAT